MLSISMSSSSGRDNGTDFTLQRSEAHFRLFDASARRTARMKTHLTGIHAGEEIFADQCDRVRRRQCEKPMNAASTRPRWFSDQSSRPI